MKPEQLDVYTSKPILNFCPTCNKICNIALYRKYKFGKRYYMLRCNSRGCYDTNYVIASSVEKCITKWNKRCYKWKYKTWQCIEK